MGSCTVRRSSTFWDELRVRTLRPRSRPAPADALAQQDTPYLATAHLDAYLLGGLGQRIQGPVGRACLVESLRWQPTVAHQPSRWIFRYQSDDPGALIFGDARLAPGSETICKAIYAFGIEAVKAFSHGLRVTAEFLGYPGGSKSLPAQRNDAGAEDPVSGSVATSGQLTDLRLFC